MFKYNIAILNDYNQIVRHEYIMTTISPPEMEQILSPYLVKYKKTKVTTDDVLDIHKFLQHFDGDFYKVV